MAFDAAFTAIDFETANRRRDSACQLAAVRVRHGSIVDSWKWMIRPVPCQFSAGNIRIHGITPDDVAASPTFGECWSDIAERLDGETLVAHNASFDIGVLRACLTTHGCDIPEMSYTCTRAVAKKAWPHQRRFGLKPLGNWLGIQFKHHDALEDSIACAKILLAAGMDRRSESLEHLEETLRIRRGTAGDWGVSGVRSLDSRDARTSKRPGRRYAAAASSSSWAAHESAAPYRIADDTPPPPDLQRLAVRAQFTRPLEGVHVVFAGKLRTFEQVDAEALIRAGGGVCDSQLDGNSRLLVIGRKDAAADAMKRQAQELAGEGSPIEIIDESGLIEIADGSRPL